MNKLRVACIGTGYFSQFHYDAWRRINNVELIASCSLTLEEANKTGVKAFACAEHMLQSVQVDIIDIITPPSSHLELISQCAQSGVKNIICQKPFCESLEQAKNAIAICQEHNARLIVHDNFRFQPWFRKMKEAIDEDVLGEIHQLSFRLRTGDGQGPNAYLERQPYFQTMDKLLIHETGVHYIDTFRYLLGKPISVYADLRKQNPVIAGEDAGFFILEFEKGIRALFDGNRHLDHAAENCRNTFGESLLEGSKASITLLGNGELTIRQFGAQQSAIALPARQYQGFAGDCVHALQSHVVQSLLEDKSIENEAHDYLTVLEIESAIYQSAETGQNILL